jgi:cytochrome c oxidase subunit 1
MPRRYADYNDSDGFTFLNELSSLGAFVLGASTLPFLYNVCKSRRSPKVEQDDPWGWGRSLEWATSSPPPRHNFVTLPRIRSESPAFDLHHPEVALLELEENESLNRDGDFADAPEVTGRAEHLRQQSEGAPPQGKDATKEGDDQ